MARGEIYTARVERIIAGGMGLTRVRRGCVFIGLTAPGEMIRFSIAKEHRDWAEGELLEIIEASPQRVSPPCPLYSRCGGCSLQHLDYEAQIEAKTGILSDALARIGRIEPPAIRIRRSSPFEYRNRVQFHCTSQSHHTAKGNDETKPRLGFRERRSSRCVGLEDCPVADAGIRKALKEGAIVPPSGKRRFTVYSRMGVFLSEGGTTQGRIPILDRELTMDAGLFFQSNAAMLELLITDLREAAEGADRTLPLADIYSGVGTFASFLESQGKHGFPEVDLVEENSAALDLARHNLKGKKVNYHALSDTAWARTQNERNRRWGFMVLDPPREGLSGPFREWLSREGPELAAYVSCDPATLARDSRVLIDGGYRLKELTMYDFYPQTAHIESLALFSRRTSHE